MGGKEWWSRAEPRRSRGCPGVDIGMRGAGAQCCCANQMSGESIKQLLAVARGPPRHTPPSWQAHCCLKYSCSTRARRSTACTCGGAQHAWHTRKRAGKLEHSRFTTRTQRSNHRGVPLPAASLRSGAPLHLSSHLALLGVRLNGGSALLPVGGAHLRRGGGC